MEVVDFPSPLIHRVEWERHLICGSEGHKFYGNVLVLKPGSSNPQRGSVYTAAPDYGGKIRSHALSNISPKAGRIYVLHRVLVHDKPHVVTMLASELRETNSPGITIRTEGPFYAVKITRLDYLHHDSDEKPFNEVAALQLLETLEPSLGPCPPSLPRGHAAARDDHHLYLFTPYGPGGDLLTYISQRPGGKARRLGEDKACRFFLDIVAALEYLEAARVVHRDLSLENLVLTLGEEMTAWEAEEEKEEEAVLWGEEEEGGEGGRQDADGGAREGRAHIHDQRVLLPPPHPDVLLGENARLPHMPHLLHALGYGPAPPPVPPGTLGEVTNVHVAGHLRASTVTDREAMLDFLRQPPPGPEAHHYRHLYYHTLQDALPPSSFPVSPFPPPPPPSTPAPKPPPPRRHWRCVLIDFGMAVRLPESKSGKTIVLTQQRCRGKLGYVSPESYYEQPINGQSTDVWSLGVILYIFLTGHPLYRYPWDPAFKALAAGEARQVLAHYREEMKLRLPETAEDLICAMLHPDPQKRPTLSELRGAPWVREVQERTRRAREGREETGWEGKFVEVGEE